MTIMGYFTTPNWTGRKGREYCSVAALSEVKDNNSTLENSSNMEFHSEGEMKRTNVTLNQRWKSDNKGGTGGGSGRVNDYIGEYQR